MNRDPRILRVCPFCSEAQHLRIHEEAIERPIVRDGDTLKDETGAEIREPVDAVACDVCEAMAPLDVWNGTRLAADYAVLRDFDEEPAGLEAA